jgi:hypothetical protein
MSTKILVPSGVLGLGFDQKALNLGLKRCPDIICIDGGSTDSGPFYLGTGTTKYSSEICKLEWKTLMKAREQIGVPLVIGTCGTCGTNNMVDWMFDMTRSIAKELKQKVQVARIYCEKNTEQLKEALSSGKVFPLEPAPDIDQRKIDTFTHIVSLAGAEPFQDALNKGADIILAGRSTDTAIISALPLMRGENPGACWHGAKIAECGAFCSSNPSSGVILLEVDKNGFTVEAMAKEAFCTPRSVSAHMLYENADPFSLHEPGGTLEVKEASYKSLDERRVRVFGSKWMPSTNYKVKLEGARKVGYQTTMLAIIRQNRYVKEAKKWSKKLYGLGVEKIVSVMNIPKEEFTIDIRLIGYDATLGHLEKSKKGTPNELGVLIIITAQSQEIATEISRLLNPYLLHLPLTDQEDLPTFAFPYSPAHTERGAVFEFTLNHIQILDDPISGFEQKLDEFNFG